LYTVGRLPEGVPIALEGFMQANARFSGGTFHSAIHMMGRLRHGARVARERAGREPQPSGRRVRGLPGRPHNEPDIGGWVIPFPTIDPQTILRSARALDRYGPDFSYSHYLVVGKLPLVAGMALGAGTAVALAQTKPTRNLLLKIKHPGEGPTPEQRARAWFKVTMRARADGQRVKTVVSGGDPGYSETSKMLSEAALCLAKDELPQRAGQLTPAVAMGEALIARLERAGIRFEVVEE
jgi:short subunit dehydrogenase-like uncharacterized protein